MSDRQWLLLGGPAHGQVANTSGNCRYLTAHHPRHGTTTYVPSVFLHGKKVYQVALAVQARGIPEDDEVRQLIESTNIQPFEVLQ